MNTTLYPLLKALALPPAANLLGLVLAWLLRGRRPRMARGLGACSVVALFLFAMPVVSRGLASWLETTPPLQPMTLAQERVDAIVVPGCGRYADAPEFGEDTVSPRALERLRYAARLQRETGLPIGLVGGAPAGEAVPEATFMASVLQEDFGIKPRWLETASRNTRENAQLAAQTMPVRRIALVTQAIDMPRARRAFELAGFVVTPAPMGFISRPRCSWMSLADWIPDAVAFANTRLVIYELLASAWYRLRY